MFVRNSLDRLFPTQPVYRFLIVIHESAMLLFRCFVYIIDLKEYSFHFYALYWMHRCQHSFKKIPSNLWVVWVGNISFQEIFYAGKPQVVSRYILSNLWWTKCFVILTSASEFADMILTLPTTNHSFHTCKYIK